MHNLPLSVFVEATPVCLGGMILMVEGWGHFIRSIQMRGEEEGKRDEQAKNH